MRAGLGLVGSAPQRTPNRVIPVIIQHQVRAVTRTVEPAVDAILILRQRRAHRLLSGRSIRPRRRRRDTRLVLQPLPQLIVGAAHMLLQCVPALRFILRQIVWAAGVSRRWRRSRRACRLIPGFLPLFLAPFFSAFCAPLGSRLTAFGSWCRRLSRRRGRLRRIAAHTHHKQK